MNISEIQSQMDNKSFLFEIKAFEVTEYLSSGVDVLINSLEISDMTKAEFFQLNLSRFHLKIGK